MPQLYGRQWSKLIPLPEAVTLRNNLCITSARRVATVASSGTPRGVDIPIYYAYIETQAPGKRVVLTTTGKSAHKVAIYKALNTSRSSPMATHINRCHEI